MIHILFKNKEENEVENNYYQVKSPFKRVVYYTFHINHTTAGMLSPTTYSNEIELRRAMYEFISNKRRIKLIYCSKIPGVNNEMIIGVAIPFFSDADEIGYDLIDNVKLEKANGRYVTLSLVNVRGNDAIGEFGPLGHHIGLGERYI